MKIALSNKVHNNLACRQSEESRFPSRRGIYPDEGRTLHDDAGRLVDKAGEIYYSWRNFSSRIPIKINKTRVIQSDL